MVPTFSDWQISLTFPILFFNFSSIFYFPVNSQDQAFLLSSCGIHTCESLPCTTLCKNELGQ